MPVILPDERRICPLAQRCGPFPDCDGGDDGEAGAEEAGTSQGAEPRRETVIAIKGSAEWKSWLDEFSLHCRLGLSDTIEQSLVYYAEERGYPEPPKR